MTAYSGKHAELYDLFYADKAYTAEANFVHECFQRYAPQPISRVLELACGTGSHSFVFEKLGYQMVATDYSPDMIRVAKAKAAQIDSTVEFNHQDMIHLDLGSETFDAAVCLFDSIGYVLTNENIKSVLANVHRHLSDGGLFVFEFWHAAAMIALYDPVRVRSWTTDTGQIVRLSETKLNVSKQTSEVTYTVHELRADGTYSSFRETQINRYFLLQEMNYFLSSCGFKLLKSFAGFKNDESISADTWHVIAVAQQIPNRDPQK